MNALAEELTSAVEREVNIIQFTAVDHVAKLDRLTDIHVKHISETEQRIAETRKAARRSVTSLEAEIARIQKQIEEVQIGADRKIAADEKLLVGSRAFLEAIR